MSRSDDPKTLDPGSGWTIEDDNKLISAYINDVMNAKGLRRKLPRKTHQECKLRWKFYVQQTGNKGAWTRHEDQILNVCQKEHGNRWKSIKDFLPGRSENAVKNRWSAVKKKFRPNSTDSSKNSRNRQSSNAALSREQLLQDAGARRKQQLQQAQHRLQQINNGVPNSADMHLRLSPGAFGMHSDSPGPAGDSNAWGSSASHNSFGFFAGSPASPSPSNRMNNQSMSLKVDTNAPFSFAGKSQALDESTSSMSREDMTELAEAFVQQEVEKFRKQHGETMSAEDQMLMRKAFVAGMQHSPPEKEMSGADLQWEFDQSGSIDGMISMDEDHGHFDGVVQGHSILGAKSPDKLSRYTLANISMNSSLNLTSGTGGNRNDMNLSIEGHSWGGPLHSDLLNTDNLDEMSMSLLNLSLEESQDQVGQGAGFHS